MKFYFNMYFWKPKSLISGIFEGRALEVKLNLKALNSCQDIASEQGHGSTFT